MPVVAGFDCELFFSVDNVDPYFLSVEGQENRGVTAIGMNLLIDFLLSPGYRRPLARRTMRSGCLIVASDLGRRLESDLHDRKGCLIL